MTSSRPIIDQEVAVHSHSYLSRALTGLNRNTVNRYLRGIRQRIIDHCEQASPMSCQIKVDESFIDYRRPGKRCRGSADKIIVFGLFKRNGKLYTKIVPDCNANTF